MPKESTNQIQNPNPESKSQKMYSILHLPQNASSAWKLAMPFQVPAIIPLPPLLHQICIPPSKFHQPITQLHHESSSRDHPSYLSSETQQPPSDNQLYDICMVDVPRAHPDDGGEVRGGGRISCRRSGACK